MQQPNHRIAAIKIYVLDAAYNCFKISSRHFRLRFDTTPPSRRRTKQGPPLRRWRFRRQHDARFAAAFCVARKQLPSMLQCLLDFFRITIIAVDDN